MGSYGWLWDENAPFFFTLRNCLSRRLGKEVIIDFFSILLLSVEIVSKETIENSEKNFERERERETDLWCFL